MASDRLSLTRLAVVLAGNLAAFAPSAHAAPADVQVCFTPPAGCTSLIVQAIDSARSEIRVQAYLFTSRPIIAALAQARRRGVDVAAILDKANDRTGTGARYSGAVFLAHAEIPVWIDDLPAIAHNKVIVIDRHLTVGGSFNYTASADSRNAENATFTESADVAGAFLGNWERVGWSRGGSRRSRSRSAAPFVLAFMLMDPAPRSRSFAL